VVGWKVGWSEAGGVRRVWVCGLGVGLGVLRVAVGRRLCGGVRVGSGGKWAVILVCEGKMEPREGSARVRARLYAWIFFVVEYRSCKVSVRVLEM
jgi:hypothetical protein